MAKLYANENFPLPVVEELRRLGHDVVTIRETGDSNKAMPDAFILKYASENARILLSFNRKHFIQLHQKHQKHHGIIVCSFDRDFIALAKRIHEQLTFTTQWEGQLVRINRPEKTTVP